jgi:hypothetical protein
VKKIYIGDSVYAEIDRGMIRLTTDNGLGASNEIYLEDSVWYNLKRFAKEKFEQKNRSRKWK